MQVPEGTVRGDQAGREFEAVADHRLAGLLFNYPLPSVPLLHLLGNLGLGAPAAEEGGQ